MYRVSNDHGRLTNKPITRAISGQQRVCHKLLQPLPAMSLSNSGIACTVEQVEPDEFKQNVKSILEHIKRFHPTARVMLMTPSTVHVERWTKHMPELNKPEPGRGSLAALNTPDREVATNKRYSGFLKNIVLQWNRDNAAEHKVALVEAFRLHALAKGQQGVLNEQLFVDGLHWSAKAHEVSGFFSSVCSPIIMYSD